MNNPTKFPSGLQVSTFPDPPAGFDATQADEGTLDAYGFPRRPTEPKRLAHWTKAMRNALQLAHPVFVRMSSQRHNLCCRKAFHTPQSSLNWCGSVVDAPDGSLINMVEGQWTICDPFAAANDDKWYYCSTWVGIDGDGSPDVCQVGVECEATSSGGRHIYPWFEWYPENEIKIANFAIAPGDFVFCQISARSPSSAFVWLQNASSRLYTSFTMAAPPETALKGNCAEWIVERPEVGGVLTQLAQFGMVYFDYTGAGTSSGTFLLPGTPPGCGRTINMTDDNNEVLAAGGALTAEVLRINYHLLLKGDGHGSGDDGLCSGAGSGACNVGSSNIATPAAAGSKVCLQQCGRFFRRRQRIGAMRLAAESAFRCSRLLRVPSRGCGRRIC